MRPIHLIGASSLLTAFALACSESSEAPTEHQPADAGVAAVGDSSGGVTDGGNAQGDGGCSDCAWFPPTCAKGTFCTVSVDGLDPRTIFFGFDAHGDDITAVGTYGSVIDFTSGAWHARGVGVPDALHGVTTHDGTAWVAGSVESVFIREGTGGTTTWTEHAPGGPDYYSPRNWAVNALFSEPAGTWVWAATATSCAPLSGSDGVGLVRMRRQPEWLELEKIIQLQEPMSLCITMNALDGAGGTLWVAGEKGALYKVTNLEASSPVVIPERSGTTSNLLGVWAESTGHVFVVGRDGTVRHKAPGEAFVSLGQEVPPVAYHAVRGTSANDVWFVGENATVMHYDGQQWKRVPIAGLGDRRPTLRAIAAITADRVWIAGDNVLLGLATEDGRAP